MGPVHWPAVRHIAMTLIMKLCTKAVEMFMSRQDPDSFHWVSGHCVSKNRTSKAGSGEGHFVGYWIDLLPVLGGILSVTGASYISVIQLGGFVTLISTVLMALAQSQDLLCSQPDLSHLLWFLPPLCAGLTKPCLFYGVMRWPRQPRHRTAACALLFVCTELGQQLEEWASERITYSNSVYALAGVLGSAVCTFLAILLQEDADLHKLEMPTVARMFRYFKIFSGLTLFVALMSEFRDKIYENELRYFGGLDNPEYWQGLMVFIGLSGSCLVSIAAVGFVELPIQARIYAGLLLKFCVSTWLLIVTAAAQHSVKYLGPVFLAAALLDGISMGLAMVAYFEFMDTITSRNSKPLVIGIMLTVWGVGGLVSLVMSLVFNALPSENPIANPSPKHRPLFFVYHLIALLLLPLSIVHHRFLSVPLSRMLIEDDSFNSQEQQLGHEDSLEDANGAGA